MKSAAGMRKQSGVALLALLVLVILAGSYGIYRSVNLGGAGIYENDKLLLRLNRAKEALIAYAVTDPTRPGRLPCPDSIGDGVSPLLTRDDCDAYLGKDPYGGWLPWKTLDLDDAADDSGSRFRYYITRYYGGNHTDHPLNSDTATSIGLDVAVGSASNDIVAVIIATRGPLDARNANDDAYFFQRGRRHAG